jgi:CTP:molybdopterin cytidylyltransferase MocA
MKAAGLITAAGRSRRMGAFKPLLPIDGLPMIARTADIFLQAGIPDLFVVIGKNGEQIMEALAGRNVRFLWNNAYETTEMFASIQLGLDAVRREGGYDGAFLLPGDMPAVPSEVLLLLMETLEQSDYDAVFPSSGTRRLHPPLVSARRFDSLIAYSGADGLRGAFREMESGIGYVLTNEAGCGIDVDTPEDYERVLKHLGAQESGAKSL